METVGDIIQSMQGELRNYDDNVPFSLFAEYAERLRKANRGNWLIVEDDSVKVLSNVVDADIEDDAIEFCVYEDDGDLDIGIGHTFSRKRVFLDHNRAIALRGILDAYINGRFEQYLKEIA